MACDRIDVLGHPGSDPDQQIAPEQLVPNHRGFDRLKFG
jgi:hypothetical protein